MPRLADLHRHHGIDVEIVPTREFDALRCGEAHLGIWGGLAVPDDMIAETMVEAHVLPVAAPRMAAGRPLPHSEEDLREEERRVGEECVRQWSPRWTPSH